MPAGPETDLLVQQAAAGDVASVVMLMQRHRSRLKRMLCARLDPRVSARVDPSDVIQEALATASQQLPEYAENPRIPFYPWLRRIAWQTLLHVHEKHLDAAKRSVRKEAAGHWMISDHSASWFAVQFQANTSTPSVVATRKEDQHRVREALATLSEVDREVLLLRYIEQLTVTEIAAILQISEPAVHMRHMRALQKMHRLMTRDGE